MRSITRAIGAAVAVLMLVPPLAAAVDVEEELRLMQQRIGELEDQLQEEKAAEARAEAESQAAVAPEAESQAAVAPEADIAPNSADAIEVTEVPAEELETEDRSLKSKLSSFLEATEFSGWVAASYNYHFAGDGNDKMKCANCGVIAGSDAGGDLARVGAGLYPLHPDNNSFSVDQVWFEIDKPVSDDSRAGFHVDWLFGKSAERLGAGARYGNFALLPFEEISFENQSSPTGEVVQLGDLSVANHNDSGDLTKLFTAYVSYLAPIHTGIQIDFGKVPSLLGAEVAQAPYNFNITRGLLFQLYPQTNVGIIVSSEVLPGFSIALGATNDVYSDANLDLDNNKAFTGQLAYSTEIFSVATSIIYGSPLLPDGYEGDKLGVLDVVITADPMDRLSMWLNFDFVWTRGGIAESEIDGEKYGLALAGRYAITDRLGLAARGEWVRNNPNEDLMALISTGDPTHDLLSVTGTLDFALTNHLQVRTEVRYDWGYSDNVLMIPTTSEIIPWPIEDYYWKANGRTKDDQIVWLLEAIYTF